MPQPTAQVDRSYWRLLVAALLGALLLALPATAGAETLGTGEPGAEAPPSVADDAAPAPTTVAPEARGADEERWFFDGGGFGHGVGMSQYGAYGRAMAGHTAAEITSFYFPTTTLEEWEAPRPIRVLLTTASSASLTPSGQLVLSTGNRTVNLRGAVTVARIGAKWSVVDDSGRNRCRRGCRGADLRISFPQGAPVRVDAAGMLSGHNTYKWGQLSFSATTSGFRLVLGELTMDKYLYGLAEVPATWPAAALEAQAIAARSYAAHRLPYSVTSPYDVTATQSDQVFSGIADGASDYPAAWLAAVDATSNQVLMGDGSPIQAFYSSSNGGYTEDSGYVWATSYPWLPAQPDTFDHVGNPRATWTRSYTGAEITQWIANRGLGNVGTIRSITIGGDVGESGRVDKATITVVGTKATVTTSGWTFTSLVNSGAWAGGEINTLPATKWTVRQGGALPTGRLDQVVIRGGVLRVVGWASDTDTGRSVPIEITLNGTVAATGTASQIRPNISTGLGDAPRRGFAITVDPPAGTYEVCAYAADDGTAPSTLLGCQSATVRR